MKSDLKSVALVCNLTGFVLLVVGLFIVWQSPQYFTSSAMNLVFKLFVLLPPFLLIATAWGALRSRAWFWSVGLAASIFIGLVGIFMLFANWAIGVLFLALSAYLAWALLFGNSRIRNEV